MISAIASRSRPARCLTRATRSESESRAIEERISVFMTCLYHAVFRARETASDARGDASLASDYAGPGLRTEPFDIVLSRAPRFPGSRARRRRLAAGRQRQSPTRRGASAAAVSRAHSRPLDRGGRPPRPRASGARGALVRVEDALSGRRADGSVRRGLPPRPGWLVRERRGGERAERIRE